MYRTTENVGGTTTRRHVQFVENLVHLNECRDFLDKQFVKKINRDLGLDFIPIPETNLNTQQQQQQQRIDGLPVKSLDCLYESARKIHPKFVEILQSMAKALGKVVSMNPNNSSSKSIPQPNIQVCDLKHRLRAETKSREYDVNLPGPRYSWIYDIVRCSVVCHNSLQLATCISWLQNHTTVVNAKNRFAEPVFNGYRDLVLHVIIKDEEAGFSHVCEVQM